MESGATQPSSVPSPGPSPAPVSATHSDAPVIGAVVGGVLFSAVVAWWFVKTWRAVMKQRRMRDGGVLAAH